LDGVAGVGGVKDVTRQLLAAIARRGMQATLVMPLYSRIDRRRHHIIDTAIELAIPVDYVFEKRVTRVRIHRTEVAGIIVYFVDALCYAQKEGIYTYTLDEASRANKPELAGSGYFDYFEMNVTLQKAALELIQHLGARPDMIHGQDAHTAFIPAMMRTIPRYRSYFAKTGAGITIHNAGPGYNQEVFDRPSPNFPGKSSARGCTTEVYIPSSLAGLMPASSTPSAKITRAKSWRFPRRISEQVVWARLSANAASN
jgi:starch synthase